jgi:hypothetical protein
MRDLAIRNTHPTAVSINGGTDATDINGDVVVLDESLISTEQARLQAVYDAQAYARSRALEYPSIPDQLDDIYHNGIDAWKATIKVTKDKYPK